MKRNAWTMALIGTGLLSLPAVIQAEEKATPVLTTLSETTLGGYVDTSAIWMFGTGNILYGRSFDQGSNSAPGQNKQDGFNLDVVSLTLDKPLTDGGWSAGYHVQLMFGPDANALASTSTFNNTSDFAIKEAYVALRTPVGNGLDFKMGVWTELLGYEVMESGSNPNFSRSFGFYLEPIIHTGLLASYKFNDILSASAGVVNRGADSNAINARSGVESLKSYTGLITLTAPESFGFMKGATLNFGILDSGVSAATRTVAQGTMDPLNYYVGISTPTPISNLSVGIGYDYRANGLFDHSYESAVDGYVMYQATEKLKFANRLEYATGSAGAWGVTPGPTQHNVSLLGETFTADYSLWANTITRAELRWDHSLTGQGMFGDGTEKNAVSLALNVIYKF